MSSATGFKPAFAKVNTCVSIGNGIDAAPYRAHLEARNGEPFSLAQMEVGLPGGIGHALGMGLTLLVRENAAAGVSRHLHQTLIFRDRIEGRPINLTTYTRDGDVVHHVMPRVATSWAEFCKIARPSGDPAAGACA